MKKFKKHFRKFDEAKALEIYDNMIALASRQTFAQNTNEMSTVALRKEIKNFYAEYFTNGNKTSAKHSLQSRLKPTRKRDIFYLAFNVGALAMQLLFFIIAWISGIVNITFRCR